MPKQRKFYRTTVVIKQSPVVVWAHSKAHAYRIMFADYGPGHAVGEEIPKSLKREYPKTMWFCAETHDVALKADEEWNK